MSHVRAFVMMNRDAALLAVLVVAGSMFCKAAARANACFNGRSKLFVVISHNHYRCADTSLSASIHYCSALDFLHIRRPSSRLSQEDRRCFAQITSKRLLLPDCSLRVPFLPLLLPTVITQPASLASSSTPSYNRLIVGDGVLIAFSINVHRGTTLNDVFLRNLAGPEL